MANPINNSDKPKVVHLPSKLDPRKDIEFVIPSEDELYDDREFVSMRIKNLEEHIDEIEQSMALAADRYDYFAKNEAEEADHLEAAMQVIEDIDKEYEKSKDELTKLRAHLQTLK